MTFVKRCAGWVVLPASLASLLGGCQMLGIGGGGLASASDDRQRSEIPSNFGEQQLADGRAALTAGRTADAIDSFMLAKSFPNQAAAAYNGLAVAYSRIGRTDLTERFFAAAVAIAPSDDRYRANLALFYTHNAVIRDAQPSMAMVPVELTAPAETQDDASPMVASLAPARPARILGAGITVRSPAAGLQRVSVHEVSVGGGRTAGGSATTGTLARRAVIEVGARSSPAYPIRITLEDGKRPQAGRRAAYPIRIRLDD